MPFTIIIINYVVFFYMKFQFFKPLTFKMIKVFRPKGDKKTLSFISISIIVSSCSLFLAGSINDNTKNEEVSYQLASIVKNDSVGGDYCTGIVEMKDGSEKKLPSPYDEFLQLRGLFRHSDFVYASTFNADKSQAVNLTEYSSSTNLSVLCSDRFSNRPRSDGTFTQEVYPLDLFFDGVKTSAGDYSWCYISESQAKAILVERNIEPIVENYIELISTSTMIDFEGEMHSVTIGDIFYERGGYFENLTKIIGEFILMPPKAPESFKSQACYFFTPFPYQNSFYLARMYALYDSGSFSLRISELNLKNTSNIDACLKAYYHSASVGLTALSWVLFVLIIGINLFLTFLCFKKKLLLSFGNCVLITLCFVFSFYIFRIIYLASNSVLFFSHSSLICFAIMFLIFIGSIFANRIYHIWRRRNEQTP